LSYKPSELVEHACGQLSAFSDYTIEKHSCLSLMLEQLPTSTPLQALLDLHLRGKGEHIPSTSSVECRICKKVRLVLSLQNAFL
jgi:hypothetical protein